MKKLNKIFNEDEKEQMLELLNIEEEDWEEILMNDKYLIDGIYTEICGELWQELRKYGKNYIAITGYFNCSKCWLYYVTTNKKLARKFLKEYSI